MESNSFLDYLERYGSGQENDLDMETTDFHKPYYRSAYLLTCSTSPYVVEVLEGRLPTMEEAADLLRSVHPYFVRALEINWDHWEFLWNFHKEACDH